MKVEKRGAVFRAGLLLLVVLLIFSFYIFADVIGSTGLTISSNASNGSLSSFDFETNMTVSSDNLSGDITYFNGTMSYLLARSGKISPIGPNVNLSQVWSVRTITESGGYGPGYVAMASLYQPKDGFVVYTTSNNYAVFTVDSYNATNLVLSYNLQNNGSNIFGEMPVSQCSPYLNDTSCMNAAFSGLHCFWDFGMQTCRESDFFGGQEFIDDKVHCFQFDGMQDACMNITRCVWTSDPFGGLCDDNTSMNPIYGFNFSSGLVCGDINATASLGSPESARAICNNNPKMKPLCTWDLTTRKCQQNATKTPADLPAPLYTFCSGATNQSDCTILREAYFMSCEWDNKSNTATSDDECMQNLDGIFGQGANDFSFNAITSQANCEAIGGNWKTESYTAVVNGVTQLSTTSWCEPSFGDFSMSTCDSSCWACEYMPNGSRWDNVSVASNACYNSSLGFCRWINASFAQNQQGFCEADGDVFLMGGDCSQQCNSCFGNSSCAESIASCTWMDDPFSSNTEFGWCESSAIASTKQCSDATAINCLSCFGQASCTSQALCGWNTTYNVCTMTNGSTFEICFLPGDEDGDGNEGCADSECTQDPACGFGLGSFNSNQTLCNLFDGTSRAQCENTTEFGGDVCFWHNVSTPNGNRGLCDPKYLKTLQGSIEMDGPPVMIGSDSEGEVSGNQVWLDIVGSGIRESIGAKDKFNIGIELANITPYAGCNGVYTASENRTGRYYRYFDTDSNTTNNCNGTLADGSFSLGYEYRFTVSENSSVSGSQSLVSERCADGVWSPYTAQLAVLDYGCFLNFGDVGGVQIMVVQKTDIGSPTVPLRILLVSANATGSAASPVDSAGPFYYSPGSIDVDFEDCSSTGVDYDHDGLTADNDPDCQKFLKFGYVPMEQGPQCSDSQDNDADGDTDCEDSSCKYDPSGLCNNGVGMTCDSTDKQSPTLTWKNVEKASNSVMIGFDTSEASNGTLIYYGTDNSCQNINTTLKDYALQDGFSSNDYRPFHDVDVSQRRLGFALGNGSTYYYKIRACDLCNNCMLSACLNFTTSSSFSSYVVKLPVSTGLTFDIPNWGLSNSTFQYGVLINESVGTEVDITVTDKTNGYSITFVNASLLAANTLNLTGDFVFNLSGDVHLGMDTDAAQELIQELDPQAIRIKIPDNGSSLIHCDEENLTNCYNVTSSANCTFTASYTNCTIPIASGLGFSTYKVTGTAGGSGDDGGDGGGSSSSGGGGGGAASATTGKVSHLFTALTPEVPGVLAITDTTLGLQEVTLEVVSPANNVRLVIVREDAKPASVTQEIDGKVYKYLSITKENLDDSNFKKAKIKFKVPKTWLEENNVDMNSVALMRFTTVWNELSTITLDAEGSDVAYEAVTSGFSVFAISGKEKVAEEEALPEAVEEEEAEAPVTGAPVAETKEEESKGSGSTVLFVLLALGVIGIGVVVALIVKQMAQNQKK